VVGIQRSFWASVGCIWRGKESVVIRKCSMCLERVEKRTGMWREEQRECPGMTRGAGAGCIWMGCIEGESGVQGELAKAPGDSKRRGHR
jgi:hypothetical protein